MIAKNIAIATDIDGKLWDGFFCSAPFYQIYSQEGKLLRTRSNPYADPDTPHKPHLIIHLLNGCGLFIGKKVLMPEHIADWNIRVVTTSTPDAFTAVSKVQAASA